MRAQLSRKGTQTPGKIMHTKLFQHSGKAEIRCYFAVNGGDRIDWEAFVAEILPDDSIDGKVHFIRFSKGEVLDN